MVAVVTTSATLTVAEMGVEAEAEAEVEAEAEMGVEVEAEAVAPVYPGLGLAILTMQIPGFLLTRPLSGICRHSNSGAAIMKASLFFLGVFLSFEALSQGAPVPHVFNTGEPIVASEFNANFQELSDRNDSTQTGVTQNTTNVSGNQSNISTMQGTITQIQNDITNLQASGGASLFQFVGNSTGTADGSAGIRVMTKLCQVDFADSRICTSEEYAKTVAHPAALPASEAWILPSNISTVGTVGVNDTFSGRFAASGALLNVFTCSGWTTTANTGLAISPAGGFSVRACNVAKPVTCCK